MTVDYQDLQINGVRVETYGTPSAAPPLLFVHGGCQGSWAWEKMAPRLAGAGWYAVCLNWFGHYGSKVLPDGDAVSRSLLNVTTEIGLVTDWLGRAPVLVAHSMGGVPSLAYASANPVTAVILLAPVLPAGLGVGPIDLPVDPAAMWLPPPHMIDATFWGEVSAQEAQRYTSLLSAESPQAVLEATLANTPARGGNPPPGQLAAVLPARPPAAAGAHSRDGECTGWALSNSGRRCNR
jgi:pimeloyl-ACP methyl ester carboxylesterase